MTRVGGDRPDTPADTPADDPAPGWVADDVAAQRPECVACPRAATHAARKRSQEAYRYYCESHAERRLERENGLIVRRLADVERVGVRGCPDPPEYAADDVPVAPPAAAIDTDAPLYPPSGRGATLRPEHIVLVADPDGFTEHRRTEGRIHRPETGAGEMCSHLGAINPENLTAKRLTEARTEGRELCPDCFPSGRAALDGD